MLSMLAPKGCAVSYRLDLLKWLHKSTIKTKRLQTFVGVQLLYFLNAALTKFSILLLLYRIFGLKKRFRQAVWISGLVVITYWLSCSMVAIMGCIPVEKNWNESTPGTCVDRISFLRWNGICNLLIDLLILCLPIPMLWRLELPLRRKVEMTGTFALGLL